MIYGLVANDKYIKLEELRAELEQEQDFITHCNRNLLRNTGKGMENFNIKMDELDTRLEEIIKVEETMNSN